MKNKFIDLASSVLYRCNQKYFDKAFLSYGLVYSQFIFLASIFESEGMMMNELAQDGAFDKGTITKSLQKLEEMGLVKIVDSKKDKRAKELYTTQKARNIMPKLYAYRDEWLSFIASDVDPESMEIYKNVLDKMVKKAKDYESTVLVSDQVKIYGFEKLSLNSYPGKIAATIYTGGCNFRCPSCNKKDLVFMNSDEYEVSIRDVLSYLNDRKNVLEGICLTGGEPLIHEGIIDFLRALKKTGLSIRLNTNGSNFNKLKEIIDEGLVDYVSLSFMNSKYLYPKSVGIINYKFDELEKTINYLKEGYVDYEFVMTLVRQYHSQTDFNRIGNLLKGINKLILKNYKSNEGSIEPGLSGLEDEELLKIKDILSLYIKDVEIKE